MAEQPDGLVSDVLFELDSYCTNQLRPNKIVLQFWRNGKVYVKDKSCIGSWMWSPEDESIQVFLPLGSHYHLEGMHAAYIKALAKDIVE